MQNRVTIEELEKDISCGKMPTEMILNKLSFEEDMMRTSFDF